VAEMHDGIVRARERQVFRDQADGLDGIPYSKKLDLYVYGKGSLELHAQFQAFLIVPGVHSIREGQLFDVGLREKSDFLKHAGESTGGEGTARETENTDLIPNMIVLHQKLIPVFDVFRKVPGNHLVQQLGRGLDDWGPKYIVAGVCSDSGLVVDELFCRIVFLQHCQELDDI